MKKQQKTETLQNTTETSPFLDKNILSANKNMKNEANLISQNFTATSCNIGGYNVFPPKTQNGTKPNEANLKPITNTLKPSLFSGKDAIFGYPYLKKQTQFPNPEKRCNYLQRKYLQRFLPSKPQKKQTQNKPKTNPIGGGRYFRYMRKKDSVFAAASQPVDLQMLVFNVSGGIYHSGMLVAGDNSKSRYICAVVSV